jgi:hypothetical protein
VDLQTGWSRIHNYEIELIYLWFATTPAAYNAVEIPSSPRVLSRKPLNTESIRKKSHSSSVSLSPVSLVPLALGNYLSFQLWIFVSGIFLNPAKKCIMKCQIIIMIYMRIRIFVGVYKWPQCFATYERRLE